MCYTIYIVKPTARICTICKSPLVFVKEETTTPEGSRFAQTYTIYRCSNEACQEEKDRQEVKRKELRKEKLAADEKRAERIAEKRKKTQLHTQPN